jgi:hypothetical protein
VKTNDELWPDLDEDVEEEAEDPNPSLQIFDRPGLWLCPSPQGLTPEGNADILFCDAFNSFKLGSWKITSGRLFSPFEEMSSLVSEAKAKDVFVNVVSLRRGLRTRAASTSQLSFT